jgi:predicted RND superfamily exporter protein
MLDRYIHFVQTRYLPIILISLGIIVLMSLGITKLSITNDFRIYFGKDNPQLTAFEQLEQTYGKQDTLYFFLEPDQGDVFNKRAIELIWSLTESAWQLPYAERVNSLSNYQHTEAQGDDLLTAYLVSDPAQIDQHAVHRIRKIILSEPALLHNLIAADARSTGVRVQLNLPENQPRATDEAVQAAYELMHSMQQQYPYIKISLAGSATAGVTLGEAVQQDLSTLVFSSYTIIILLLLVLLRSIRGMLITVALITLSTLATMGTYGWLGKTLTPVAGWVPSIIMTIAVADSVHILITYFHGLRIGQDKYQAIAHSLRINARPVFITSLTTIIGVLCLNFSDSPPYQDLGNMIALGALYAYLLTISLLPAVLFRFQLGKHHSNKGQSKLMSFIAQMVIQYRHIFLLLVGSTFVILASFITNNELTERWHEYFDESFPLRTTVESINNKLTGVHYIHYVLDSEENNGIHEPEYLNTVEDFSNWLRKQPGVAYVGSLTDISKRLNRTLHADNPQWYRIPDNRPLAAQLFLLYEIGLPRELNLDNLVNLNRSASLVTTILHKTDSEFLLDLDHRAQQWLQQHATGIKYSEGTGLDMIFAHINHRNIRSLLTGTVLALILISFVLIIALQSVKLGLLSLIPNLVPAAMAYGTWGLLVGRVDMSASVVICMSLGIVVDDTVHFLSKYLYARRQQHLDTVASLQYAFQTVGMALMVTTIVLVCGFLVLVGSHFSPTWVSGSLMAITLSYALLADFFFLPPILILFQRARLI